MDKYELAHYAIGACTRLLADFETDLSADKEDRLIPNNINNPYTRGGLIQAINIAADLLVQGAKE